MKLFIAEKPSVAADIVKALGGVFSRKDGYYQSSENIVTFCFGHIIESQPVENYNPNYKVWSLDNLPLALYPIKYQPKENCKQQVKTILSLINNPYVDTIVHCGDPDDEGQLLVDEVLQYGGNTKPVLRVMINDNTPGAVQKALQNMQDNRKFHGLSKRALARSAADAIYGLSMTVGCTVTAQAKGYKGLLSVGRVQTPTLGLIVRRWRAHTAHKSSFYYTLKANMISGTDSFSANWKPSENAPQDEKKRLTNKKWGEGLAQSLKGKSATVSAAAVDQKEKTPPLPFNLARLQQFINKEYKFSAQKTQDITQKLKDTHKAITYNRSDCSYLTDEQFAEAPVLLSKLAVLSEFNGLDFNHTRKSKAFNTANVTAHTAIIPTIAVPDLNNLSNDERIVYMAIAKQYFVQFMPNKKYNEASAHFVCGDESFVARSNKVTDLGFTKILSDENNEEAEETSDSYYEVLSRLRTGECVTCESVKVSEKKTTPPALFTEATLLAALVRVADYVENKEIARLLKEKDKDNKDEHGGIGTPATRAGILEILKKREYVIIEKGKLVPTESGLALFDSLPPVATLPDMTALWSKKQDLIEAGEVSIDSFVGELYEELRAMLKELSIDGLPDKQAGQAGQASRLGVCCPNCKSQIAVLPKFCACTGCDFKIWSTISDKKLTTSQIETLIEKGQTTLLKGFKKKADGSAFEARLKLVDTKTGKVSFLFK
ncbi:type IA DNA topoisomerase [Salmonella enterica]|nr:type IA DNA topoisomerase [Salmonella enterica]